MSKTIGPISKYNEEDTNELHVFAAVDVSGSMSGSKIQEVCSSLRQIIDKCPNHVVFDITLFSTHVWKIAACKKSSLNFDDLQHQIEGACALNGTTALYDAWGGMLSRIPSQVLKTARVQIFILTDGEDNASKRHTVTSVLEMCKKLTKYNTKLNFVQCGKGMNTSFITALENIQKPEEKSTIQTHVVDDDASGVKTAMATVHQDIISSTSFSVEEEEHSFITEESSEDENAALTSDIAPMTETTLPQQPTLITEIEQEDTSFQTRRRPIVPHYATEDYDGVGHRFQNLFSHRAIEKVVNSLVLGIALLAMGYKLEFEK